MENLYRDLKDKKDYTSRINNVVDEDYYNYFVNKFLPEIIMEEVNKLKLEDSLNISSLSDIKTKLYIYFFSNQGLNSEEPKLRIDGNDCFLHFSKADYNKLTEMIINFATKRGILSNYIGEKNNYHGIIIDTDLNSLIIAYSLELSKNPYLDLNRKNEIYSNFKNYIIDQVNALESYYVDDVLYRQFEEEFLDLVIVDIIKEYINGINYRNLNCYKLTANITVGNTKAKDNTLNAIIPIIQRFMQDYDLGEVDFINGEAIIKFKTDINSLIDAYYMEKQRLEYYKYSKYSDNPKVKVKE